MATAKKTTPAAPRKTTAASRTTAKIIRNRTTVPVHLRLKHHQSDDPFRVVLNPRGAQGDVERIPAALIDTQQFQEGIDTLFEIITATEAKKIKYAPVGYLGDRQVQIIRPEDVEVRRMPDWDGKGRPPYARPGVTEGQKQTSEGRVGDVAGPAVVHVPGSTDASTMREVGEDRRAKADDMIPAGVDTESRQVRVQRVKG